LSQSFAMLGLSAELTRVVAEQGYSEPTPVQAQAIPVILAGRDVLAGAQTGTGKTAGFTLPLLQRLSAPVVTGGAPAAQAPRRVRALILTPTRELAAQVEESVRTYGQYLTLKSTLIYGGVNINPQIDALRRGVDILVATPGRLLDHLQQKTASLAHVEILVLDEADRMLDMGFIRDIRRILALLPARRQNLLFSATFSNEIRQLADGLLHAPALIDVARRNAESELVAQLVHPVDAWRKRELLTHLVSSGDWRQVLVFTRMKSGANRLAEYLCKAGIEATAIHGNKSQPARTRALAGFKTGTVRVLVATDIAARGLDIEELPHVVNFELPNVPADYVHRIGRTGRAGSTGVAISLVSAEEAPLLADIEKLLTRRIERQIVVGFEPGQVQPPAAAEAQAAAERAARDANRRGTGHPGKPGKPGKPGAASPSAPAARPPARPGAPAAQPARGSIPAPLPGSAPRAPQRARAGAAVALPALFRSPTRRGS
jgi:ATP-dependent RNA helicase RhlE